MRTMEVPTGSDYAETRLVDNVASWVDSILDNYRVPVHPDGMNTGDGDTGELHGKVSCLAATQ